MHNNRQTYQCDMEFMKTITKSNQSSFTLDHVPIFISEFIVYFFVVRRIFCSLAYVRDYFIQNSICHLHSISASCSSTSTRAIFRKNTFRRKKKCNVTSCDKKHQNVLTKYNKSANPKSRRSILPATTPFFSVRYFNKRKMCKKSSFIHMLFRRQTN